MDSLEAFERGRDLPPEALNHGSPINPFKAEIIPLRVEPSIPQVWQGYNRSGVFFLDEHIVLKAQKQYHVPSVSLPGDRMLLELGLANFRGTQLERQAFAILKSSPHPNLVSISTNGRLKLMGFGASPRRFYPEDQEHDETAADDHQDPIPSAEVIRRTTGRAHQRLASCLHYILTGVDPDEQAQQMGDGHYSQTERVQWREKVRRGEYAITSGAEPIVGILQDAWTLRTTASDAVMSFSEVERKVRDALGPVDIEDDDGHEPANDIDLEPIEERCRAWLGVQEREPKWMGSSEYEEAVREATADCNA
ncbi:hypothetical protein SLS64_006228 [Diaporthe eres]